MEVGLGARRGRRWRRSSRLEVEAPWGIHYGGPYASYGRAWRAARGGVREGGGAGGGGSCAGWRWSRHGGIHRGGPVLAAVVLGGRCEAESEREEELVGGACLRPGHG